MISFENTSSWECLIDQNALHLITIMSDSIEVRPNLGILWKDFLFYLVIIHLQLFGFHMGLLPNIHK